MRKTLLVLLSTFILTIGGIGCGGGGDTDDVITPQGAEHPCQDFRKLFNGSSHDNINSHWECRGSLRNLKLYSDGTGEASYYKEGPIRMHWELISCSQFRINPDPNQEKLVGEVWGLNKFSLANIVRSDYADTLDLIVKIGASDHTVFCKRVQGQ